MRMHRLTKIAGALVALAMAAFSATARAQGQTYPENKPIVLVIPFAPGGGTDALARPFGKVLSERLGQPVVLENKGGGGGMIAAQYVAKARPDGHTLLMTTSTFLTAASGQRALPYDVLKDFTPVSWLGRGPLLVIVNKDTGITTLQDLIARGKAKPDSINFASSGVGSVLHLAGELFIQRAGIKATHIPYQGAGPGLVDLLAGHVQLFLMTVPSIIGHVKSGGVTLLATTGTTRMAAFPNVPTVAEAAIPGFEAGTWWGITGPAGLPPHVIETLDKAVKDSVRTEVMRKRFEDEGAEIVDATPAQFGAMLRDELAVWRGVVKDGNLKFE